MVLIMNIWIVEVMQLMFFCNKLNEIREDIKDKMKEEKKEIDKT